MTRRRRCTAASPDEPGRGFRIDSRSSGCRRSLDPGIARAAVPVRGSWAGARSPVGGVDERSAGDHQRHGEHVGDRGDRDGEQGCRRPGRDRDVRDPRRRPVALAQVCARGRKGRGDPDLAKCDLCRDGDRERDPPPGKTTVPWTFAGTGRRRGGGRARRGRGQAPTRAARRRRGAGGGARGCAMPATRFPRPPAVPRGRGSGARPQHRRARRQPGPRAHDGVPRDGTGTGRGRTPIVKHVRHRGRARLPGPNALGEARRRDVPLCIAGSETLPVRADAGGLRRFRSETEKRRPTDARARVVRSKLKPEPAELAATQVDEGARPDGRTHTDVARLVGAGGATGRCARSRLCDRLPHR